MKEKPAEREGYIELFDREKYKLSTRLEIEIFAAPHDQYITAWKITVPEDAKQEACPDELDVMIEACIIAAERLEVLKKQIEDQQ
jgi:hypothetical protein